MYLNRRFVCCQKSKSRSFEEKKVRRNKEERIGRNVACLVVLESLSNDPLFRVDFVINRSEKSIDWSRISFLPIERASSTRRFDRDKRARVLTPRCWTRTFPFVRLPRRRLCWLLYWFQLNPFQRRKIDGKKKRVCRNWHRWKDRSSDDIIQSATVL